MKPDTPAVKPSHTPTPWTVRHGYICEAKGNGFCIPVDWRSITVLHGTESDKAESLANAAFIVRAVNCHEELLEMLYQCRSTIPIVERPKGLDDAIAKAEGK